MKTKKQLNAMAKKQAIADIKKELRDEKKVFLLYRTELDPIMDELIDEYTS